MPPVVIDANRFGPADSLVTESWTCAPIRRIVIAEVVCLLLSIKDQGRNSEALVRNEPGAAACR
jgi:hypothetical protein